MKRWQILLMSFSVAVACGETVTLPAARDVTLYEDPLGNTANGSGSYFFAGTNAFGQIRRALIEFDVGAVLPAGATVQDVQLTLHMSRTAAAAEPVALHRALADWGEGASDAPAEEGAGTAAAPGDATWLHTFYDTNFWPTPGGAFVPEPSAVIDVFGNGYYTWGGASALVEDVQTWLDDPARNHGWMLVGHEAFSSTAKRFDSVQNPDPAFRPLLLVRFAVPEPAPAALLLAGLTAARSRSRGGRAR
jgi:hypothetical protein